MGFGKFMKRMAAGFGSVVKPALKIGQGILQPLSILQPQLAPLLSGVKAVNSVLQNV